MFYAFHALHGVANSPTPSLCRFASRKDRDGFCYLFGAEPASITHIGAFSRWAYTSAKSAIKARFYDEYNAYQDV